MTLTLSAAAVTAFFLALVRATAFVFTAPPFTLASIPFTARTAVAGGIALSVVPTLERDPMPLSTPALIGALVVQVAVGVLIGLVVQLFVGAVEGAGNVIDQFAGLNLPPSIDPLSLEQAPLIGQLYDWVAVVLLFVSGGVEILVRGFMQSFSVVGTTLPSADVSMMPTLLSSDIVSFFAACVEIAAPVVAVLFLAQVVLGLLAKSAPQANVFALGFPLQILLALLVLTAGVTGLPNDVASLVQRAVSQLVG